MAQDLVAKVPGHRELRAERELIGPILHLVEGGQLSALVLADARHGPQRVDLVQRAEAMSDTNRRAFPAAIDLTEDLDHRSRILRRAFDHHLRVRHINLTVALDPLDLPLSSPTA